MPPSGFPSETQSSFSPPELSSPSRSPLCLRHGVTWVCRLSEALLRTSLALHITATQVCGPEEDGSGVGLWGGKGASSRQDLGRGLQNPWGRGCALGAAAPVCRPRHPSRPLSRRAFPTHSLGTAEVLTVVVVGPVQALGWFGSRLCRTLAPVSWQSWELCPRSEPLPPGLA